MEISIVNEVSKDMGDSIMLSHRKKFTEIRSKSPG